MITKPYYRISRPFSDGEYLSSLENTYLISNEYANDRISLIRSFHIICKDLMEIFDYIDSHDANLNTFSHRIYELFLRASTEFESNCKGILKANDYSNSGNNINICDYFKLNKLLKLNEYEVGLNFWQPNVKIIKPFQEWNSEIYTPLTWYQKYNSVKHHRSLNFSDANLDNLLNSIASVFIMLHSQFNIFTFGPYQPQSFVITDDYGFEYIDSSIFKIKKPVFTEEDGIYHFDWSTLKNTSNPFDKYNF